MRLDPGKAIHPARVVVSAVIGIWCAQTRPSGRVCVM